MHKKTCNFFPIYIIIINIFFFNWASIQCWVVFANVNAIYFTSLGCIINVSSSFEASLDKVRLGRPNRKPLPAFNFYLRRRKKNILLRIARTTMYCFLIFNFYFDLFSKKSMYFFSKNLLKFLTIYIIIINLFIFLKILQ